jgi:putative sterol carrier protein
LDDQDRYLEDIDSGLNNCLTLEANIDQAARALRLDIAMTLFDKGVAAVVPVDTSLSPEESGGYDILTLRVGDIVAWYPKHVRVNLYNEAIAERQEITLPKSMVAIIENPLYSVMNEPNSTLRRLLHKLNLLDAVDEQSASGKLDLIIQLPYVIKSEARRQQAEQRRSDIEFQLKGSQYGIAYTDGTEKITQLNRPVENNLMGQVEFLTTMLYGQLGLTDAVMNGTADEKTMLNYWNRTVEPVLSAITQEFRRKFLTKTARTQRQSVMFFRDPFRLVPVENIAEIADKFTRNEIMTSNEMRQVVGMKPHPDPKADQLLNSNMPQGSPTPTGVKTQDSPPMDPSMREKVDSFINEALSGKASTNGNSN